MALQEYSASSALPTEVNQLKESIEKDKKNNVRYKLYVLQQKTETFGAIWYSRATEGRRGIRIILKDAEKLFKVFSTSIVNKLTIYDFKLQKRKIQVMLQENLPKSTDNEAMQQIAWKDCEVYFTSEVNGLDYLDQTTSSHIYQQSISFLKQCIHTCIEALIKQNTSKLKIENTRNKYTVKYQNLYYHLFHFHPFKSKAIY